jgi:hypothetical protein
VECGDDDVSCFGGLQRDLRGLHVADFTDDNDVGREAQRLLESLGEAAEVAPELALREEAAAAVVDEFDGVFERDDVFLALICTLLHERGDRGALALPRRPAHKDEPLLDFEKLAHDRGLESNLRRSRDVLRQHAQVHPGALVVPEAAVTQAHVAQLDDARPRAIARQ